MTWQESIESTCRRLAPAVTPFCTHVHVHETVASTNDVASALALRGAPEGTLVIARTQTRGRGRRGGLWDSPAGAGLYLSVVLRPGTWAAAAREQGRVSTLITIMAGVAVVDALRQAGAVSAQLKWLNDVVVPVAGRERPWRKLAGILAEAATTGVGLQHVVLGIGINMGGAGRAPEVEDVAVCLADLLGGEAPRHEVTLEQLVRALASWRGRLAAGEASAVTDAWRRRSPSSRGWRVSWEEAGQVQGGVTASIDETGALLVDTAGGRRRIVGGSVSWATT